MKKRQRKKRNKKIYKMTLKKLSAVSGKMIWAFTPQVYQEEYVLPFLLTDEGVIDAPTKSS